MIVLCNPIGWPVKRRRLNGSPLLVVGREVFVAELVHEELRR